MGNNVWRGRVKVIKRRGKGVAGDRGKSNVMANRLGNSEREEQCGEGSNVSNSLNCRVTRRSTYMEVLHPGIHGCGYIQD